jgi:hypothetical protein
MGVGTWSTARWYQAVRRDLRGLELRVARRDTHGGRWLKSIVVAEGDMVVQFRSQERTWPGGSFLGFETPPGTATRDVAFAYRLVDGRIAERWAIRDDLVAALPSALPSACRACRARCARCRVVVALPSSA